MGRSVADLTTYFHILLGRDPLDSTSTQLETDKDVRLDSRRLRIGVPQEYVCEGMSQEVIQSLSDVCHILETEGCRNWTQRYYTQFK